ncbi:hypothetical protein IGI04_007851, partial [Brassica rapa subsp. trilocularis]
MDEWIKQCKYARYQLPETCSFTCPQVNFLELIGREHTLLLHSSFSRPISTLFAHTLIIKHPHIQINQLSHSLSTKHQ